MSELIVIGNGFDLHHGLPTSYGSFAQFARDKSSGVYEALSGLFLASREFMDFDEPNEMNDEDFIYDRWRDFETCLGLLDDEEFGRLSRADISEYMYELGMDENLVLGFIDNIASVLGIFRDWVFTIDLTMGKQGSFKFDPEAAFLNFNYTETLETFYGVDTRRINYVHGSRTQSDLLIVGHDESPPKAQHKDDLPDIQYNPYYAYLRKTKKPVDQTVPKLSSWLEKLPNIELISIRGHSLGYVDLPYFEVLFRKFPTAKWSFSYYDQQGIEDIKRFVRTLGISHSKIASVSTLRKFETNPDTSENAL